MTESNIRDLGARICERGFPVVAIMPGEKRPIGTGWQSHPLTADECRAYPTPEAGVGILCGYGEMPLVGIDADIEGDAELANKVFDAWGRISPATFVNPKRIGKAPKFLIVARTAQAIRKMVSAWFEKDGRRIRVEILGKGQQFVAYHTHPDTGKPYDWSESLIYGNLYGMDITQLEPISVDELRLLLDKFEELAAEAGYAKVGTGSTAEPAVASRFEDMTPETPPLGLSTEKALNMIETAELDVDDYDTWLHVGMALHHEYAGGREGRDAWDCWSQKGSSYRGPAEIEAKWESFGRNAGAKITMRWVQAKWRESAAGLAREYHERGLVARVVVAFNSTLRYLVDEGDWAYFNGQYWETLDDAGVRALIADFIDRAFNREVAEIKDEEEKAVAFKFVMKCRAQYARVVANVTAGVKAQSCLFASATKDLRPNVRYLSVGNGTLDCQTMKLVPAAPEYHVRQHLGIPYLPDAPAPHWRKAVLDMMDGNQEMAEYLQKLVGCALLGCQTEEMMVFLVGGGCNGKTLFLSTIRKALGCYAKSVPANMLTISGKAHAASPEAATPALLALKGVRFAYCSETPLNARLAESVVKALTGHDPVTARGMYAKHPVEFDPTWLIFMATNHMPIIQGTDYGIWRRIRIVHFPVQFDSNPRYKLDNQLAEKLEAELQGVFAWAVEGAKLYQRDGLKTPAAVEGEVARTRENFDLIGDWLEANCVLTDNARLATTDAWRDWQSYARITGDGKIIETQRTFTRILQERFPLKKSNGRNYAYGLRLKTADELAAEEQAEAEPHRLTEAEIEAMI